MTKRGWKYYLGVVLFLFSFVTYALAFFSPKLVEWAMPILKSFFPSAAEKSSLTIAAAFAAGIILLGEVCFLVAVVLLGKPVIRAIRTKITGLFKISEKPVIPKPIGAGRHYLGVFLFLTSFLPYVVTELALILGFTSEKHISVFIVLLLSGDALFVISLFVLGNDFLERVKRLFIWRDGGTTRE